jgi:phage gp45-like
MEHLQYHHFLSQAKEGAEAVVMPAGDRAALSASLIM